MSSIPSSTYTGTFLELLTKTGSSLVVSTYQAKKLVVLRVHDGAINTHFIDIEKPMGVAYQQGRLSVGAGKKVVDYFNSTSAAAKIDSDRSYDGAFLPRRMHITGDIDIHEMAFDDDGELWIINTKMSCLCTLDVNHSFVPKWRPPFISGYDSTDRCHLNGLAMRDGKPRYVTALGTSDDAAGWRGDKAQGGVLIDIDSNQIIASGLSMPHSPRWYQNRLYVLESGAGRLLTVDPETGVKTVIAEVPGFCRGIDFLGNYAMVGLSQIRETAMFAGLPLTKRKEERQCGIWIVDLVKGKSIGYLSFSSGIEEIFSVQCLPMAYPTILDFDHILLNTSYSVPVSILEEFVSPKSEQIQNDQAREYHKAGEYPKAIKLYEAILEKEPDNIDVIFNLGHALSKSGQWDQAITYFNSVVAAQDDHAQAWNARGHFYTYKNDLIAAIESYDKAISIDQQFASAHYHKACIELRQGNFAAGLKGYRWRTKMSGSQQVSFPRPEWQGEDISDKTLLVVVNQGYINGIQFARYLPEIKKQCQKLIIVCDEPLRLLFKEMTCINEVQLHGELQNELFDVYCSITSLGSLLLVNNQDIHVSTPYLSIGNTIVVPELAPIAKTKVHKIGLVWSNNQSPNHQGANSLRVEDLLSLAGTQNIEFYSFQQPVSKKEKALLEKMGVVNLESKFIDFAHLGALMQQMDLMLCVDSVITHLAGALNLPTIVLLGDETDWRWIDEAETSIWYPTIKVLRRKGTGSWDGVLKRCSLVTQQLLD